MNDEYFSQIVNRGYQNIPEEFRQQMDNVAITIADFPSAEQVRKLQLRPHTTLFGLYEGVPLPKRSNYSGAIPDKITIFKYPILRASRSLDEFIQRVEDTVWHEVAHYFGMNEEEVRDAEKRRDRLR